MSELLPEDLAVLQHALGVDKHGQGAMYRNHFAAGGEDVAVCQRLVRAGLMRQVATTSVFPDQNFVVTEMGKTAVREQSPPPPKLTRSQRRYREFLDSDSGISFREWLRWRT